MSSSSPFTRKSVLWSMTNTHHTINEETPLPVRPLLHATGASPKPILRKSPQVFRGDIPSTQPTRQCTPEPSLPQEDAMYLAGPMRAIVDGNDSLSMIIEAYNKLGARLKTLGLAIVQRKRKLPALQPFIENKDAFTAALERDINRARENPITGDRENQSPEIHSSPEDTKERTGMTEEQVKTARDVSLLVLAAVRFSGLILSSDVMQTVFSTTQVLTIFNALIAIPVTPSLPSQNARKIYSIAISVVSVSTLPIEVAKASEARVTFALRRAIEGELGREGKRGAITDGLKAIRELCIQQPKLYADSFSQLLPAIFSHLVTISLPSRLLACYALCGLASAAQVTASDMLKQALESCLKQHGQMLHQKLKASLVPESTAAPWALCVLACLIQISGGSTRTLRLVAQIVPLAMKHKKYGVRMLASFVWRCLGMEIVAQGPQTSRSSAWPVLNNALNHGTGLGMIIARTVQDEWEDALDILKTMVTKGATYCSEAAGILSHLVAFDSIADDRTPWEPNRFIPIELFDGTFLNAPFSNIGGTVKAAVTGFQSLTLNDIRPMPKEQVMLYWPEICQLWKDAAVKAELGSDGQIPEELVTIWQGLLCARCEDLGDSSKLVQFQGQLEEVLMYFLLDETLQWTSKQPDALPASGLRYGFVTHLWSIARETLQSSHLNNVAGSLINQLLSERPLGGCVAAWAELIAHVAVLAPNSGCIRSLESVSGTHADIAFATESLWKRLLASCSSADGTWEDTLYLLAYPFRPDAPTLAIDEGLWEESLRIAFFKIESKGEQYANAVSMFKGFVQTSLWNPFLPRAIEILLRHVWIDADTMEPIASLCSYAMAMSYENLSLDAGRGLKARWLSREIVQKIESAPSESFVALVSLLQDGLIPWIRDANHCNPDYEFEIEQLHQCLDVCLPLVNPPTVSGLLEPLTPLFMAFFESRRSGPLQTACVNSLKSYLLSAFPTLSAHRWPGGLASHLGIEQPTTPSPKPSPEWAVLSPFRSIPVMPSTPLAQSSKKRCLSHSDASSRKKRKVRLNEGNENSPPSPSVSKVHRRASEGRQPLQLLEEDNLVVPVLGSTAKDAELVKVRTRSQLQPKKQIMDYISVPTLAQLNRERRATRRHSTPVKSPVHRDVYWSGSDDTLVGDSPRKPPGNESTTPQHPIKSPLYYPPVLITRQTGMTL